MRLTPCDACLCRQSSLLCHVGGYHKILKSSSNMPSTEETIIFEAEVRDAVGHSRSFSIPYSIDDPQGMAALRAGKDSSIISSVVFKAQREIIHCGIDWRFVICSGPAKSSINSPMAWLEGEPMYIRDPCFMPICLNPSCKASALRSAQEIRKEIQDDGLLPNKDVFATHCFACGKTEKALGTKMSKCSKCKLATYCDKACQTKHWRSTHKHKCVTVPKK